MTRALASLPAPWPQTKCLLHSGLSNLTTNQGSSQDILFQFFLLAYAYYSTALQRQHISPDANEHAHAQIDEHSSGNVENSRVTLLALDSDDAQTSGAERWVRKVRNFERKKKESKQCRQPFRFHLEDRSGVAINGERSGDGCLCESSGKDRRITHKTIHITPSTLLSSIDEWISSETEPFGSQHQAVRGPVTEEPVPVFLVGLHACGSLTPDIIRAFLSSYMEAPSNTIGRQRSWIPAGILVVGCCYNLLAPSGKHSAFPLATVQPIRCNGLQISHSPALSFGCLLKNLQFPSRFPISI